MEQGFASAGNYVVMASKVSTHVSPGIKGIPYISYVSPISFQIRIGNGDSLFSSGDSVTVRWVAIGN